MSQVNEDAQDQIKKLLAEIIEKANRLSLVFEGLSSQDKILAGSLVLGVYNPWTEVESIFFVGTRVMVPPVVDRILYNYRNQKFSEPGVKNEEDLS